MIDVQGQVLGERIPIVGTPFFLEYRSDRVFGRLAARSLDVSLTGADPPPGLVRVELEVLVAGRSLRETVTPAPNQRVTVRWDGRDAYGRQVQGARAVLTRIDYVYRAVYQAPAQFAQSFAAFSGVPLTANRARQEITLSQEWQGVIGGWISQGLGGWTLDVHHALDPRTGTLYPGNDGQRNIGGWGPVITTLAGTGLSGFAGDGGLASAAQLDAPAKLAVGADGSVYIADRGNARVRRITPDGIIRTIAGNGLPGASAGVDVLLNADGSALIADRLVSRIRRVAANGSLSTVVGNAINGFAGDGGPARLAQLNSAAGLARMTDGALLIADTDNHRLRRVGPDGVITTLAGTGLSGFAGDGGPASAAQLDAPAKLAVGADGSVYIADRGNARVRRITPDGIIRTIAGNGLPGASAGVDVLLNADGSALIADRLVSRIRRVAANGSLSTVVGNAINGFAGDGGPARLAQLSSSVAGLARMTDGALLIADTNNHRLRQVGPDGVITTLAGTGLSGFAGDGGPASAAELNAPDKLAVSADGSIYIADRGNRACAADRPGWNHPHDRWGWAVRGERRHQRAAQRRRVGADRRPACEPDPAGGGGWIGEDSGRQRR